MTTQIAQRNPTGSIMVAIYRAIGVALLFQATPSAMATLHDRGAGLIYDDVLDVTWLQDANYFKTQAMGNTDLVSGVIRRVISVTESGGAHALGVDDFDPIGGYLSWWGAKAWAQDLTYHDSIRGRDISGWRLPSVEPINGVEFQLFGTFNGTSDLGWGIRSPASELAYMYYVNLGNSPNVLNPRINGGPFVGLRTATGGYWDTYWSSAEYPNVPPSAFAFEGDGSQWAFAKHRTEGVAWVVHNGDIAAIPEPATYALLLLGISVVGIGARHQRRRPLDRPKRL